MNAVDWGRSRGVFANSIFALMERVEYRRISTREDFDAVGELRKLSYFHKPLVVAEKFGELVDDEDFLPDVTVVGVYIDEKLVSSVRLHHVTPERPNGPTLEYFPSVANQILGRGETYIDPSRFATDPESVWQYPLIPFFSLRSAAMASEFFNVDRCLTCIRADNAAFYKRSFGSVEIAAPICVEKVVKPLVLLGARITDIKERMAYRYPFFKSQRWEQKLMFAPESELTYPPVTILPSARYANAHLFA